MNLTRALKRIERRLPPIARFQEFDFSLELGYVIYKGIRIHWEDFHRLFPNSILNNVDFDVEMEIIRRLLVSQKAMKDLGLK